MMMMIIITMMMMMMMMTHPDLALVLVLLALHGLVLLLHLLDLLLVDAQSIKFK